MGTNVMRRIWSVNEDFWTVGGSSQSNEPLRRDKLVEILITLGKVNPEAWVIDINQICFQGLRLKCPTIIF